MAKVHNVSNNALLQYWGGSYNPLFNDAKKRHCDHCGELLPLFGVYAFRGNAFCKLECSQSYHKLHPWPDPVKKAALEKRLSAMRQRRAEGQLSLFADAPVEVQRLSRRHRERKTCE